MQVFEKRDPRGNYLSLWVIAIMAFLAPICGWSIRQLQLNNDLQKWLPGHDPELAAMHWTHQQFGTDEQILLTWDGSSINDSRVGKLVEQLLGKEDGHGIKRGGVPYISSVTDPRQTLLTMQQNGIEPREAARRLEGTILGAGPLRLRLSESGRSSLKKTKRELQIAARARFGLQLIIHDPLLDLSPLISIPVPSDSPESQEEISAPAILSPAGQLAESSEVDHDLQVSWRGMRVGSEQTLEVANWLTKHIPDRGEGKPLVEECFFAIGSPVALMIGISEAGLADKGDTVQAVRTACRLAGIPAESLHLAGNVVAESELNSEVVKSAWDTSYPLVQIHRRSVLFTSMLVSTLLAFVMIRRLRLASIVLLITMFATFAAMAIIPMTGGSLNVLLILIPVIVIVLTFSASIHFADGLKQASHQGTRTFAEMVKASWRPGVLAGLITTVSLLSLCTSPLVPVREFGIYAALGAVVSSLAVMYGLPAFIRLWPGKTHPKPRHDRSGWNTLGELLTVRPGLQSMAVLAVLLGLSFGVTKIRPETRIVRYFLENARIAQDYWFVETNLSGATPVDTIIRFDEQSQNDTNFLDRMELIRQIQQRMWAHPEISGSISLADFQPVSEPLDEEAGFLQKSKHNKKATVVQQRIREGEIPVGRAFYTVSDQPHDLAVAGDQLLNQAGDELWRITAHANVMADQDFSKVLFDLHEMTRDVLKLQPGSQHSIVGTVPLFVRTQQAVVQSLTTSLGLAIGLVFVMLIVALRSFSSALIATLTNLLPMTVAFGILSWMQHKIDLGSILTAAIAFSIGINGAVRYISMLQNELRKGLGRREAVMNAIVHAGPAIFQSSAVVAIGMLALIPAELPLVSRFGALMAAMVTVASVVNLVLIPQLLSSAVGSYLKPDVPVMPKSDPLIESQKIELETEPSLATVSQVTVPNPPHINPIDASRKKRRPSK